MRNIKKNNKKQLTQERTNKTSPTKKRGRPPKINKQIVKASRSSVQEPKRKRGRPRKEAKEALQAIKPRRGRPPKSIQQSQQTDKIKADNQNKLVKKLDCYGSEFEARLFINKKPSSKQLPEFDSWLSEHNKFVENNLFEKQKNSIRSLELIINNNLDTSLFRVDIPAIFVTKGEKITFVLFDPFDRGAEVLIKYKTSVVPSGATPLMKQTVVCNKITEMVQKILPVGVCC